MTDDEDPFERLDPVDDRDGDPFEQLDPADDGEETTGDDGGSNGDGTNDTSPAGTESTTGSGGHGQSADDPDPTIDDDLLSAVDVEEFRTETDADDPFADFEDARDDPFGDTEGAFERVDVDHLDADKVWAEITGDGEDADASEDRYAEVSKHRYCEQCEHFSEPPNARCTNEGTELVEFLDMETVRLRDCPVVAEQHDLESEQ
ncbi:hypothetical protein [Haloarcula salina]|uniref:DUF8135 domain-containing protein n=1 Tax=Haloarcula salina TaxID=1429914 RepID=A0AA41KB83_9EURY|nr:hypothetical protein [Haloarcula salina]MBV0900745.1 hypothetical protein [Haloarcula salina]